MGQTNHYLRGQLDLMLLSVLADEPLYGYLIQDRIRKISGHTVRLSAGSLYPLLHSLEKSRLIKSRWEQSTGHPRKWYELTAKGRRQLRKRADLWRTQNDCVGKLLDYGLAALDNQSPEGTAAGEVG